MEIYQHQLLGRRRRRITMANEESKVLLWLPQVNASLPFTALRFTKLGKTGASFKPEYLCLFSTPWTLSRNKALVVCSCGKVWKNSVFWWYFLVHFTWLCVANHKPPPTDSFQTCSFSVFKSMPPLPDARGGEHRPQAARSSAGIILVKKPPHLLTTLFLSMRC